MPTGDVSVLPFQVAQYRFALPIDQVRRVDAIVEPAPLPGAPDPVIGLVSVHGDAVPLVDLRQRLRAPEQGLRRSDHMILTHDGEREIALRVDTVEPVVVIAADAISPPTAASTELPHIQGVGTTTGGLLLIYDLAQCLAPEERDMLADALAARDHDPSAG
ncbi:chemotaxis protein CheW [Amorphus sp. 3PC139-8]|uniref:chemotaxis protein CheW n=1 Tax=Amorphus sp. 3PC139-8 TaxID=2735676 RepID=UPI00345DC971